MACQLRRSCSPRRKAGSTSRPSARSKSPAPARFAATKLDAGKLAEVEGHAARVAIEVFSGRRSSPNNLLDCDFFDDLLSVAAEKPVQAHCKLIGEQ